MNAVEANFHTGLDQNVRAYQIYQQGIGWGKNPVIFLTTYNVSLSYQFYPHLHPYVLQLARTLSQTDSVYDMLGMSVLYATNPDGSIQAIDDSTRAFLAGLPGGAKIVDGAGKPAVTGAPLSILNGSPATLQVQIAAGTGYLKADGSSGTLAAALVTTLTLPIAIPNSPTSGFQAKLTDGTLGLFAAETLVTLPAGAGAYLSDGTQVSLPAQTQVLLRTGLPLPQQAPVQLYDPIFTSQEYKPGPAVRRPYPVKDLDFSVSGAYSIYNWELFFHAPLMIAIQLSQNQQFQDAQNWFHTIFDPTDDSDGPTPARFWKIRPFQYHGRRDDPADHAQPGDRAGSPAPDRHDQFDQRLDADPVPAVRRRPVPAHGLHAEDGHGLPGQPDRLGRQPVPAIHDRDDQRGDPDLRAGGQHPRPEAPGGAGEGVHGAPDLRLDPTQSRPVQQRAGRHGGGHSLRHRPSPGPGADPTGANTLASIGQTQFFCIPQNDRFSATGTRWPTGCSRSTTA